MKTPFTRPGQPADLVERWGTLERILTGPLEESCLAILRHIALGCAACKQEDVILKLVEHRFTMREAVLAANLLMADYLTSERGSRDTARLERGKLCTLHHDDHGRPVYPDSGMTPG